MRSKEWIVTLALCFILLCGLSAQAESLTRVGQSMNSGCQH